MYIDGIKNNELIFSSFEYIYFMLSMVRYMYKYEIKFQSIYATKFYNLALFTYICSYQKLSFNKTFILPTLSSPPLQK